MEFKLTISEELIKTIESMGYDLHSYFDEVFTKPLVAKHRIVLELEVLAETKAEIDEKVNQVKDEVIFEEEKREPTPDPEPVEEPPVEEPPADEKPVEP